MIWEMSKGVTAEVLGIIPMMLDEDDPDRARDQLDKHYQHGGGWRPMKGFELTPDFNLKYKDDPPLKPLALTFLRDELVVLYEYEWVAIIQPSRCFEVCRMD